MRSLIELETFISLGEKAEFMANDSFSDVESDGYKTAFVAHFKSLCRASSYDFVAEFLVEMVDELNSANQENPDIDLTDGPHFEFGYITQFLKYLPDELEHELALRKASHGGVRKGAGRPKQSLTKQIRVDSDLSEQFKMLSDLYRGQSDADKALLLNELIAVGVSFCHGKASKYALDDI